MVMNSSRRAQCFRDLIVYQKARKVGQRIFELSRSFPKEETYSLTDQGRRSCRSIGAQIAEAWGKRRYERHFVSKLTDADAEQLETQHWLETAFDCSYISEEQRDSICSELQEIGRMLNSMIQKAESFCDSGQNTVGEKPAEYFVEQN
jgi:four helix bundle protein